MSNIFKRLRLIGRREEREETILDCNTGTDQENCHGPTATERPLEQILSNTRGGLRHQRPRYRRSARKRLCFPSKHDNDELSNSCRKTSQEGTPHASHSDTTEDDPESYETILLKDDIKENEVDGSKGNVHSTSDVDFKTAAERADDMNESFEVLMPDLLSSNGYDLSTKKITKQSDEATPDPPVLHRMDTGPVPRSLSKEDVDLPAKSPITRSQMRKGEFQLLKLLCSDDNTTPNNPLPLLTLSKEKRNCPAFSLDQDISMAPMKRKDAGEELFYKKNGSGIERNNLNAPLGESNIRNITIPLLLSRSSRDRKQAQCRKIRECNDESVKVLELESQRIGKEENSARNAEKEGCGPDKDKLVGSVEVKEGGTYRMHYKEVSECEEEIEEPIREVPEPTSSAEAVLKSQEGEIKCLEHDAVLFIGFEEMQDGKGNDSRKPNHQEAKESTESTEGVEEMQLESAEPTESTEVENRSDGGNNESQESNELQGGSPEGLQSEEGNDSREPRRQEKSRPTESPKVDNNFEAVDGECQETNAIQEGSVDGMQCKEESNDGDDTNKFNRQERAEPTESTKTDISSEGKLGIMESLDGSTEQGEDVSGMQCNEHNIAEENCRPTSQKNSKAIQLAEIEKGSKGLHKESQKTSICVIQEVGADGMLHKEGNENRKSNSHMIAEHTKSSEVGNHGTGRVTFDCNASVLNRPQDAPISSDLSPTITPWETYEMFAAPNSHGKFNGRWPMSAATISHLARVDGRTREIKTERQRKMNFFDNRNIDTYNMPRNHLDWCGMVPGQGSYYSQEGGMFVMTGAVPRGQPREFSDTGGYYCGIMSAREQIPVRSADDLDAARTASSNCRIDSQGAGELESDPSGNKTNLEGNEDHRNAACFREHEQVDPKYVNNTVFQPHFDGHYMIDSTGCYIPVNHQFGTMIPPPGFQEGPYGHYGYSGPIEGQYYPNLNQKSKNCTNLGVDEEARSTFDAKRKDSDYQLMSDSFCSFSKASAGGDEGSFDETSQQTKQEIQDIHDALRILLHDAFDPSVSDPGELLAMYGAELLKDEELRLEFIYFCEQLFNYEIMMSQSGSFFPGACGDFAYPYPTPFTHHAMWPPPDMHCPPGWYPNDVAYFYDGESYLPVRVHPDPQGNLRMVLPDGHPDQYGPRDYMPIYTRPNGNAECIDGIQNNRASLHLRQHHLPRL